MVQTTTVAQRPSGGAPSQESECVPPLFPPAPDRLCDLIMKGGVTSGVVYPRAVTELAQSYRFKNIGGTSAGAIAAAVTAAAEFGRQRGTGTSFGGLYCLPPRLATDDFIYKLFQPQPKTTPLFDLLTEATDSRGQSGLRLALIAMRGFWPWATAGAVLGLLAPLGATYIAGRPLGSLPVSLAEAALRLIPGRALSAGTGESVSVLAALVALLALILLVLAALAVFVAVVAFGTLVGVVRRAQGAIPENFYGLCSGFGASERDGVPPLTVWLAALLDRIAGVDSQTGPLTFGDLWGLNRALRDSPEPERRRQWEDDVQRRLTNAEQRVVNLELMTTCLTLGRPYSFPLETGAFYFRPDEFRQLFPERVVDWMIDHSRQAQSPRAARIDEIAKVAGCLPLPVPADLPVVVAARMSLSVPPLVSAIPLHAFDFSLALPDEDRRPEPCWFSDGGITSNFPVHFFDSPLPRWPTFAINLRDVHPSHPLQGSAAECENVYLPRDNRGGMREWWNRLDPAEAYLAASRATDGVPELARNAGEPAQRRNLLGFFAAIVHTMQNWNDNVQLPQPGFRDRIAHVSLDKTEGGFNLRMPPAIVDRLSERGRCAGELLRQRFTAPADSPDVGLTWANHRWVRYRRTMAALDQHLSGLRRGYTYTEPPNGIPAYADLIRRAPGTPPDSYPWNAAQRTFAPPATDEIVKEAEAWANAPSSFDDGDVPRPLGRLRIIPQLDQ